MNSADATPPLPDLLAQNLSIVFCGINPGVRAASTGHHFAGRGNRFWPVLYRAGFTPELIQPEGDRAILRYGYGLTAVVARATARADQLSREEIRGSGPEFERKIKGCAPRYLAFLGKMAFAALFDDKQPAWGPQPVKFGGAHVWILPNPSGLNRSFSFDDLVDAYRELRITAATSP